MHCFDGIAAFVLRPALRAQDEKKLFEVLILPFINRCRKSHSNSRKRKENGFGLRVGTVAISYEESSGKAAAVSVSVSSSYRILRHGIAGRGGGGNRVGQRL